MEKKYSKSTIADVERSIACAYASSLSSKEMSEVKDHLAHILPMLHEPNALIQPIKDALAFIHAQEAKKQSLKDWLGKPVLVALVTALITTPISFYAALSIERSKAQDCQPTASKSSTQQGRTNQSSGSAKVGS